MKDLRDAIKTLVNNTENDWVGLIVNDDDMANLIAEYNIHFVEPEDKQLEFP